MSDLIAPRRKIVVRASPWDTLDCGHTTSHRAFEPVTAYCYQCEKVNRTPAAIYQKLWRKRRAEKSAALSEPNP